MDRDATNAKAAAGPSEGAEPTDDREPATTEAGVDGEDHGRQAESPRKIPAKGWKDVALRVKGEAKRDQVPLLAAGVAFFALLALVPALVALVSIYGLVGDPQNLQRQIEDVASAAPADAKQLITDQLTNITEGAGAGVSIAFAVGLLGALWSASSGMKHLIGAVTTAYDEEETRGFLKLRGLALGLTVGAMIFVVVTMGLMAVLPAVLGDTSLGGAARVVISIARFPVLALAFMLGLAVIYRYGPDRDQPQWSWATWGAGIATGLWILGSILFSIYTSNFGKFNETYGSLSAIIVLMLWLMLTAFVVVIGAEINAELESQTAQDTTKGEAQPMGTRGAEKADTVGAAQ